MFERLGLEIDVKVWPVEMNAIEELDFKNAFNRGVLAPRIFRVGEEVLIAENKTAKYRWPKCS